MNKRLWILPALTIAVGGGAARGGMVVNRGIDVDPGGRRAVDFFQADGEGATIDPGFFLIGGESITLKVDLASAMAAAGVSSVVQLSAAELYVDAFNYVSGVDRGEVYVQGVRVGELSDTGERSPMPVQDGPVGSRDRSVSGEVDNSFFALDLATFGESLLSDTTFTVEIRNVAYAGFLGLSYHRKQFRIDGINVQVGRLEAVNPASVPGPGTLAAVPEPGTLAAGILGVSLLAGGHVLRRRRASS